MSSKTLVQNYTKELEKSIDYIAVLAVAFNRLTKGKLRTKVEVFATSMANINKALAVKVKTDPYTKLLEHFHEFLNVFSCTDTNKLLLLRSERIDYSINLEKKDGKTLKVL